MERPRETAAPGFLWVHVLATTPAGTRSALTAAKRLTDGLDARVVLLVPRLRSLGSVLDPGNLQRATLIDAQLSMAAQVGVRISLWFCMCHSDDDAVRQMLGPSSLLIVGGQKRMLSPSREERLVRRLVAEGFPVVFAPTGPTEWSPQRSVPRRIARLTEK